MAPAIIQMLREGDDGQAIATLAKSFSPTEYAEGLKFAAEHLGIRAIAEGLGKAILTYGGAANVTWELFWWTWDGLKSISEAHEAGDRDSRIAIYANAFAETFLYGESAGGNEGLVSAEQKEAFEKGRKDGAATAARTAENAPSVGKALLAKYAGLFT